MYRSMPLLIAFLVVSQAGACPLPEQTNFTLRQHYAEAMLRVQIDCVKSSKSASDLDFCLHPHSVGMNHPPCPFEQPGANRLHDQSMRNRMAPITGEHCNNQDARDQLIQGMFGNGTPHSENEPGSSPSQPVSPK
jgi:hypothetical protein